jgi:hypothetical protein
MSLNAPKWSYAILLAAFAAAGCAGREPIVMEPLFAPPGGVHWTGRMTKGEPVCRVALTAVRDVRSDTQSMGMLGGRAVRAADSTAWVRAGFETLKEDARIAIVKPDDASATLRLSIDLLKAHVASVNMAKTANVAVRVTYAAGTSDPVAMVLRGEMTDVNWGSGDGEAFDLMNQALAEIVAAAHPEVIVRCAGVEAASAAATD